MTESAFDAAVRQVSGEEEPAAPAPAPAQPASSSNGKTKPPAAAAKKRKRRPGEKGGAQKRREREARAGAPAGEGPRVQGPPPPPAPAPISPELVSTVLRQLDGLIVATAGTKPLTALEAAEGGACFAPVFDHYFPQIAEKGGIWLAPTFWTLGTYGPRVLEHLERRRGGRTLAAGAAEMPVAEAPAAGEPFRPADAEEALQHGYVAVEEH